MTVINKQTVSFEVYMDELKKASLEDGEIELGHDWRLPELHFYYMQGCDIDEALIKYKQPY